MKVLQDEIQGTDFRMVGNHRSLSCQIWRLIIARQLSFGKIPGRPLPVNLCLRKSVFCARATMP